MKIVVNKVAMFLMQRFSSATDKKSNVIVYITITRKGSNAGLIKCSIKNSRNMLNYASDYLYSIIFTCTQNIDIDFF